MFSITYYFVKCSASHFPKENVQQTKMLESGKMLCFLLCKKQRQCKNVFDAAVFFAQQKTKAVRTFCVTKCDALLCFAFLCFPLLSFPFLCKNTFLHQIHFCIKYIFASNTFVTFCFAEHFPKENVMLC